MMQVIERDPTGNGQVTITQDERPVPLHPNERFIGVSPWATRARATVEAFAAHHRPVILEGEAGTGKRLLARLAHDRSARGHRTFVAISFHQGTAELFEQVLFGYRKTSSDGRDSAQSGLVESVGGGTLYINVAPPLIPSLRTSLARLLDAAYLADIRIILGLNKPAQAREMAPVVGAMLSIGDYFAMQPLRERTEDIEPLSRHFVQQFCLQSGKEVREIDTAALARLRRHDWPGNVGELKATMNDTVQKSAPPRLEAAHFPTRLVSALQDYAIPDNGIDLSREVKQFEHSLLCAALKQSRGVQLKAAQLLNIKPTTLNMKLARYGIDVAWFK